jgi:KDO2-lipid IV(A) lauroyltransferase
MLLGIFPFQTASALGGFLAERLGPYLKRSEIARKNLEHAMPELSSAESKNIISDMWNNLGRTFAEFPHIASMSPEELNKYFTIEGLEYLSTPDKQANGSILFTAHLANWELAARSLFDMGYPVSSVYRKGNNPQLGRLIQKLRSHYVTSAIPKGQYGSRQLLEILKSGGRHKTKFFWT